MRLLRMALSAVGQVARRCQSSFPFDARCARFTAARSI
jgi:hypothetical protein